ncbi:heparan-alpha-glucosaminide N-acetyltransferase domain-containing protein [Microbacterium imperiale]|uniref:Heparan-alpha-glucosaminide N-acetyltransferase catalytic domain-containing protein n=1 Tax=Microbacterium imperiale TaxID=33884 RepID=A0A9W6HEL1_9MICO|nr:heparan-alpha-glucosaminide N-acetyltransferase domain-containing protein [Microbacterium imperiale]MBP2420044.1 putative membrane protein [Microbacterium imperiale]BFE40385.1 heparan-alpha-glucosaminide N-acetyltransferase domain-containing protein [Microbacterium imperiale]GLJ78639.1 hypothetical protein GCM10017586_03210 [Microbacterium imperiale]
MTRETGAPRAAGVRTFLQRRSLFAPSRIDGVDLARGIAVIGMLAAHLLVIPDLDWTDPSTYDGLVHGRSSILFATLAGVSIGLVSGGRTPVRGPCLETVRLRLLVRAGAVWVIGVLLLFLAVPVYVILPAYAILFVLAAAVLPLRARTLFIAAAAVGLIAPFPQAAIDALMFWSTPAGADLANAIGWHYPFLTWFAFVLAGMGAARLDLRARATPVVLALAGAVLAAFGTALDLIWGESEQFGQTPWTGEAHSSGLFEVIGSGGFALLVIGLCVLLCRTPLTWLVLPVRAMGSMPLTAYSAQIVVWALTRPAAEPGTFELDVYRDLEPFWPMTLGIIAACTVWALLVGRGPLEAGVDALARLAVRGKPAADGGPPTAPDAASATPDAGERPDRLER